MTLEERFWSKVNKDGPTIREDLGPCWLWMGHPDKHGYGRIRTGGRGTPTVFAHRLSYQMSYGVSPGESLVCHSCDVRMCVNPAHFFLGTHALNIADKIAKGRQAVGDRCGNTIIKEADLPRVLAALASGVTPKRVATEHGVSVSAIYMIRRGHRRNAAGVPR